MIENRWSADRELTGTTVEQLVVDLMPEHCPAELAFLGSGWDNDVYLLNRRWVLRFPRRAEVAARAEYEARVAVSFQRRLAAVGVNVPVVERWFGASAAFPYPFTLSRRVPGESAASFSPSRETRQTFTASLAGMLSRLHATPLDEVPDLPKDLEGGREWLAETMDRADDLARLEGSRLKPHLKWLRNPPAFPNVYHKLCVVHNDLCPDHVFVEPRTGRTVGLIDVSDASWGDPVLDFTILPGWLGVETTKLVIQSYQLPLDVDFVARLRFSSRVLSLKWLYDAHVRGGDIIKHRRWVHNAFAF